MKNAKYILLIILASVCSGQVVTLSDGYNINSDNFHSVQSGDVAKVTAIAMQGNGYVQIGNDKIYSVTSGEIEIIGPASVRAISPDESGSFAFIQLKISGIDETSEYIPQNAIVIPATGGDYNVILECSEDLQTWTPCAPGQYGSGFQNRFFRVRLDPVTN